MNQGDLVEFIACPFLELKLSGVVVSYSNSWAKVMTIMEDNKQEHYFDVHRNDILKIIKGYQIR